MHCMVRIHRNLHPEGYLLSLDANLILVGSFTSFVSYGNVFLIVMMMQNMQCKVPEQFGPSRLRNTRYGDDTTKLLTNYY